jgi:hypothetical protein
MTFLLLAEPSIDPRDGPPTDDYTAFDRTT